MPRIARVVVPGVAHHVTQRGNNRQDVFFTDDDRRFYLRTLGRQARRRGLTVRAYCLMTNHVHLVVVPLRADSLAKTLGSTHLAYAQFINRLHGRSGHLWQNRFFSCALADEYEVAAMRYVERNAVRARLVRLPWRYKWSSAAAHCDEAHEPTAREVLTDVDRWRTQFPPAQWRNIVQAPEDADIVGRLRRGTGNGRPLGSDRFIAKLERTLNRRLRSAPVGRPKQRPKRPRRHAVRGKAR